MGSTAVKNWYHLFYRKVSSLENDIDDLLNDTADTLPTLTKVKSVSMCFETAKYTFYTPFYACRITNLKKRLTSCLSYFTFAEKQQRLLN